MMNSFNARHMLVAILLVQASGCGSPTDEPAGAAGGSGRGTTVEPPWTAPFGGSRQCYATKAECSNAYQACKSDCLWRAISDPTYNCLGTCSDSWPCLGGVSSQECPVHSYHFSGGPPLMDLEAACESAVARDKACGTRTVFDNCNTVAMVESPDVIANYECVAQTPCGESPTSCSLPEDRGLENEICGKISTHCSALTCTSEARAMLRSTSPWFRADTISAARACLQEKFCREITACLNSWNYTAFAGTESFLFFGSK
jgi:hypothetical protein